MKNGKAWNDVVKKTKIPCKDLEEEEKEEEEEEEKEEEEKKK